MDKTTALLEVIKIQEFAVHQVKELLDRYKLAKSLYSVGCLNLAYYICELKLIVGEIDDQAISLLYESSRYEKDRFVRALERSEIEGGLQHFYQSILDHVDSSVSVSLILGIQTHIDPQNTLKLILTTARELARSNERHDETIFLEVFHKMEPELLSIYKRTEMSKIYKYKHAPYQYRKVRILLSILDLCHTNKHMIPISSQVPVS